MQLLESVFSENTTDTEYLLINLTHYFRRPRNQPEGTNPYYVLIHKGWNARLLREFYRAMTATRSYSPNIQLAFASEIYSPNIDNQLGQLSSLVDNSNPVSMHKAINVLYFVYLKYGPNAAASILAYCKVLQTHQNSPAFTADDANAICNKRELQHLISTLEETLQPNHKEL